VLPTGEDPVSGLESREGRGKEGKGPKMRGRPPGEGEGGGIL